MPQVTTRGSQGRVLRERQGLGHMPLLKFMGGVLCDSWARDGLVNSNQKCGVLINPLGVLSKMYVKHTGAGREGRLLIRAIEEFISVSQYHNSRNLPLLVTLWAAV